MTGSEFIFGRRPVLEMLQAGKRSIHKIWIAAGSQGVEEIVGLARDHGAPAEFVRRERLDRMVKGHHQGIVAEAGAASLVDLEDFLAGLKPEASCLLVALDEIQDPHNVGAILRSAGFFGISGAIVPRWRTAPVGETAARVSSGAVEHIPLFRVRNLSDSMNDLKNAGFEVVGADMGGAAIDDHSPNKKSVIIFGSEGKGLRRLIRERCDKLVKIPGRGPIGSLNVSAAAAIFLYKFASGLRSQRGL